MEDRCLLSLAVVEIQTQTPEVLTFDFQWGKEGDGHPFYATKLRVRCCIA
jgi:hypothetical protein